MTKDEMEQVLRHFDEKAAETQRHFDEKAVETQHHFDEKAAETERHFDIVAEGLRSEIQIVAEGVVGANERLDRHAEAMRAEFAEVRAMIKFSYSEWTAASPTWNPTWPTSRPASNAWNPETPPNRLASLS